MRDGIRGDMSGGTKEGIRDVVQVQIQKPT